MFKVSPETALKYTKFSVSLMFTWPPWPESSRLAKLVFDLLSWFFLVLSTLLVVTLLYGACYQLDDRLKFTKTICMAVSCVQTVIKMLVAKANRADLEILQCRVKEFIKNATPHERETIQRYIDRCALIHLSIYIFAKIASIGTLLGPLLSAQALPTDAKYPFSVEEPTGYAIAYVHQVLAGMQCSELGSVDCQAALLIWFVGARLELLADEFQAASNLEEFNICVEKHQSLLKEAEQMVHAVRYFIVTTSTLTTVSIIFGAIHIVSQQPLVVKSQFVIIDLSFAAILFLSAWPSENLVSACYAVGHSACSSPWIEASPKVRKNIIQVVQRSQKPVVISLAGVLPELSLSYYAAFLSKTFSFFTTLRIILGDEETEVQS